MTREMNKPEEEEQQQQQRILNPDIAEFVNELNERLGQK